VSVLITASTPWLLFVACVLRRVYSQRDVHLLLVTKGDAPSLRSAFDALSGGADFTSREIFGSERLSVRLHEYLTTWRARVTPGEARRRLRAEAQQLQDHLERTDAKLVVVGNKFHAPERMLAQSARRRGATVGFYEEGLSIYQRRMYWERSAAARLAMQAFYRYHNVHEYYGEPRFSFDEAWVSLPNAYHAGDAARLLAYGDHSKLFGAVGQSVLARHGPWSARDSLHDDAALVLSQRLSEDGLVTADEELGMLADAVTELLAHHAVVYFKPHPRDRMAKFPRLAATVNSARLRCLDDLHFPIEVFFSEWRPRTIVGFMSGTLVYAPMLYGIPSYTIARSSLRRPTPGYRHFLEVIRTCGIPDMSDWRARAVMGGAAPSAAARSPRVDGAPFPGVA
jgi:Alpha-2,8-polysialyltransferase (POLYST)